MVLYLGQTHWNELQQTAAKGSSGSSDSNASSGAHVAVEMSVKDEGAADKKLLSLTSNWPADATSAFKQAVADGRPFKILFVGSPAIGSEDGDPYADVKARLIKAFGAEHIEVGIKTYSTTSTEFLKDGLEDEVAAVGADLIVFEPFILANNGLVTPKNTFADMSKIIEAVKERKPETTFVIQPAYPLYQAKNYPRQVEQLKEYTEEQQLTYLNHWIAWPDIDSEEMKNYLGPDLSVPNEQGNKLWSDYLIHYLISDGGESQ